MQKPGSRSFMVSRGGWALVGVAIVAAAMLFSVWHRGPQYKPAAGIVVVRGAPVAVTGGVPLTPVAPGRVAPTVLPPEAVVADVQRAYPLLSDIMMNCDAGRCVLTGTIRPVTTQDDLDRRQEMLLGGLAAALAGRGYAMAVPFEMDEAADNTFQLRARVTPSDRR